MSMPAAFIAWIAPSAISSLLARRRRKRRAVDSQLVIRFCASSRDQLAVCWSMMLTLTAHSPASITS
jgi:hypothetical protein